MRAHDEDILQRQCNAYLELLKAQGRIMYIHIPGSLQRFIWNKASHVPIHIAKEASNESRNLGIEVSPEPVAVNYNGCV